MNPEDLARRRWRRIAKAVEKRNRLGAELAKTNERLVLLRNELPQAEQADRAAFAAALAAGKAEPDRMAEQVAANIAVEERRSEALQTAVQQAESELQKLCEQNRTGWYRDTLAAIGKAHRIYEEAIEAVAQAREGLADEVALADWIRGGVGVSPIVDTLAAQNGGEALSFSRVLQALNADAEQVAGHLPEPEPRVSWQRVREHAEALVGQGLSREEAVKQAGSPEWAGD
jgi:DNA repair exonuclease SbcCD ATPase subunit